MVRVPASPEIEMERNGPTVEGEDMKKRARKLPGARSFLWRICVLLLLCAFPPRAGAVMKVENWDYLIGVGEFTPSQEKAVLDYAAGRCEPLRPVGAHGAKRPLKARPGHLSHLTLELFSIPNRPDNLVQALKKQGTDSICYFSGGSLNLNRPEDVVWVERFRKIGLLGPPVQKFSSSYRPECRRRHQHDSNEEKMKDAHCYWGDNVWLRPSTHPLMYAYLNSRVRMCAERGFSAIEADNVNSASQEELRGQATLADEVRMLRMITRICARNNVRCGLKNSGDVAQEVARDFDFAVVERCRQYRECDLYHSFVEVLGIEYDNNPLPLEPNFLSVSRGESEMQGIIQLIEAQCRNPARP